MPTELSQARERLLRVACPHGIELAPEADGARVTLLEPRLSFSHSFISGNLIRRARQKTQALLGACQSKQRNIDRVLDLTAGWGADALTLACHGQRITLLEQNELLFAVIDYARALLASNDASAGIAARLEVRHTDAGAYLEALREPRFDLVYLDPMFPAHKSGAKPGKEMQILQRLTENQDIETCFELALQKAARRVVVKRPLRAPALRGRKPDLVYREKTVRFDVYLV